jgi:hypothetical protein
VNAAALARGARPEGGRRARRLPPAWLLAALLAGVYLILAPQSPDLAAASYRSRLFGLEGFSLWDNSWYGGHHLLAYSLLAPALGWLITAQLLAALSMVGATALFSAAVGPAASRPAADAASWWFAIGASVALLSSRVPFDLGLAIGLAAVVLAQRRHRAGAAVLSVMTSLASPVAGAFLAMAMLAWALAGSRTTAARGGAAAPAGPGTPAARWSAATRSRAGAARTRGLPAALCLLALAPIGFLTVAFPEGGSQPFVGSAFWPALAAVVVVGAVIPPGQRLLRIGAALYALVLVGSFAIPSAVGGNADRLGALAAGPVAALALLGARQAWRRWTLIALIAPLTYWQANAPITDYVSTVGNPATRASYYAPLLTELARLDVGYGRRPARIEVVPTVDHWEARYLAPAVMIARGWERQLDRYRNPLFYDESPLTAGRYHAWLLEQAVSYVALSDAPPDYSAVEEARLLGGAHGQLGAAPAYLREVWRSAHWRLFAVRQASPLATAPATLAGVGHDSFSLHAPVAGTYTVRLRFTPYWALTDGHGCVSRAPGDWTRVRMRAAGSVRVAIRFSLGRVLGDGPRCR